MINKLSTYSKYLVYIVIIVGIMELILPNNKNKKYIKIIMGMFVIFSIINPVVGKRINMNNEIFEKYINTDANMSSQKEDENDETIKDVFKIKLKENIKSYINSKGYDCKSITVKEENYNISEIEIFGIEKKKSDKEMINRVQININNSKKQENVTKEEIQNLTEYLAKNYEIEKEKIYISEE